MTGPFAKPTVVYVASSSKERWRAQIAMGVLDSAGLAIALDWTREFSPIGELDDEGRRAASHACANAIDRSDALLLLAPTVRSDSLWEAGYAHGRLSCGEGGPVIFVAGPVAARGIFAADLWEYETDAAAIAAVIRWAREGQL